jgi:hypothetical protein
MSPTLETLLRMPWTIQGPTECYLGYQHWYEIRVAELSDFFVAGATWDECANGYLDALESFLASYTEHGETPPVSPAVLWRWLGLLTSPAATTSNVGVVSGGSGASE